PLDVHLMVHSPEKEVPKYYDLKPEIITFHAETTNFMVRLCEDIRSRGIRAGVALNPSTPLESIEFVLPYIDLLLIMTVDPGFYGQKFTHNGMQKIRKAKEMIKGYEILLEVDGGVNSGNIRMLSEIGVDICVTGSALFTGGDVNRVGLELKSLTN
ncbi:MAG: ribulose-phosphate 3-epimerase, partial [Leptospiraceae bacterium]|nr:ribulose-phosphate 3-epimerase [Leptospiraceae bacterium]